jgi:hypothetical protein
MSTHDSRHDERTQSLADVPPAYAEESAIPLPEYSLHAPEPVTLAMYLFKFGFCKFFSIFQSQAFLLTAFVVVFPPFWFFGAFILLSPLREPPSTSDSIPAWMPEKTEEERQQIIANIREVELKWARRCLWAFVILIVLATLSAVAASFLLRQ